MAARRRSMSVNAAVAEAGARGGVVKMAAPVRRAERVNIRHDNLERLVA